MCVSVCMCSFETLNRFYGTICVQFAVLVGMFIWVSGTFGSTHLVQDTFMSQADM